MAMPDDELTEDQALDLAVTDVEVLCADLVDAGDDRAGADAVMAA
jgi:hypothetical protein